MDCQAQVADHRIGTSATGVKPGYGARGPPNNRRDAGLRGVLLAGTFLRIIDRPGARLKRIDAKRPYDNLIFIQNEF